MGSCCPGPEDNSVTPGGKKQKTPMQSFTEPTLMELATATDDELLDKFKDKVNTIIAKGEKFTDPEFPPEEASIFRPEDGAMEDRFEDIEWARASELFDSTYDLYTDGIDPNDVQQGQLGDCYFLATLSSMAEFPERIEARFHNPKNDQGVYLVSLYINALHTPIIIDDYLPVKNGKLAFAKSKNEELWVCLLEKAWAKCYGSYQRMEGGDPAFAAVHLTGMPARTVWHDEIKEDADIEGLWKNIYEGNKDKFQMMCGSAGQGEARSGDGIISGHAYSLIDAFQLENNGHRVRLLKLRNPWGQYEWKGDWSDQSDKWTPELKEQVDFKEEDDGEFFINFMDYLRNYATTSFCVSVDTSEYKHSRCIYDLDKQQTKSFKFTLTETVPTTDVFTVSVAQQGQRLRYERSLTNKFSPSAIKIKIFNEGGGSWLEGAYQRTFNNWLECDKQDFTPGTYYVEVTVPVWNAIAQQNAEYRKICVDILSKQELTLIPFDAED